MPKLRLLQKTSENVGGRGVHSRKSQSAIFATKLDNVLVKHIIPLSARLTHHIVVQRNGRIAARQPIVGRSSLRKH
jgi:hypothetical protein